MSANKKKALAILQSLEKKTMDENKYVTMREGEKPKKGARVIANGQAGSVLGSETVTAPDAKNPGVMKDHLMIKVSHPEGSTKEVSGVGNWGTVVAPKDGFDQHYDSSRVRVHQDDIISPK